MEKKMTQKEMFNEIIALARKNGRSDIVEFAKGRIALLDKKSENRSQTKTQKENVEVMEKIKSALGEVGKAVTITELQAASAEMAEYSNQKLSALLKKLVENGEVVKTTEKKKSYFSLAEQ